MCSQFQTPQVLHCVLELNFTSTEQDFCCRFTKGKVLKLTKQKDKLFSMNNFKTDTMFSKHLKEDERQENLTKKALSRNVISDNYSAEVFFQ